MRNRLKIHNFLVEILGNNHVYYSPTENVKIEYPCIVYKINNINNKYANDNIYNQKEIYKVTVITKKAENDITDRLSLYPRCIFNNHYVSDGLHHDTFTIYS